jgi:Phage protein Gp138 N-terminal domain
MSFSPDPELREAIDAILADFRTSLHTSFPARVTRYDVAAQTVDVQPALRREEPTGGDGESYTFDPLPPLYGVPVLWPRGGGFAVTFPLAEGDWVLVHCAEQSTAPWRQRGQAPSPPGLNDPHGLNGCVAIPGWYPDVQRLAYVSPTDYELRRDNGEVLLRATPEGELELGGGFAEARLLAIAEKVEHELDAISTTLNSLIGGSSAPAEFGVPYNRGSVGAQKVKGR